MTSNPLATRKRYELVAQILRDNIGSGRLPPGFLLLEGPVAERMATSRAPVQHALRSLVQEGLIHRSPVRGFAVGPPGQAAAPVSGDIRKIDLTVAPEIADALAARGTWQHFYEKVESQVAFCLIFGRFRIVETELGEYLGVSRTVVRDILVRLHEFGLIRKTASSHWMAGPLTAQAVRERFQLLSITEPEALRMAAPHMDFDEIARARERLACAGDEAGSEALEALLFDAALGRAPNGELVQVITRARVVLAAVNRALTQLGLPRERLVEDDYRMLFDLLSRHSIGAAAEFRRTHLINEARKSIARLKIVSVVGKPPSIAPYFKEVT